MKVIGLTGGVGMGKSTAAGFLLESGVRVVDTDEIARTLVQPGQSALVEIQNEFGSGMISATGELKRDQLARLVFADQGARRTLEAILHPRIRQAWESQIEMWRADQCPRAVVVIPLLFETQAQDRFDKIICVACSPASQQERLRARQWSAEQIGQRIAAQMPVTQKIAQSHFVVWTEGSPAVHRRQITEILRKI